MAPARKPTPASEWEKSNEEELVDLPSGSTVLLRPKVKVFALVREGVLTPEHLQLFVKAQQGELDSEVDDLDAVMELNDALLRAMFVEPQIHTEDGDPPEGHIRVEWINDEDVQFVLERAMGGAPDAASFRGDGRGDKPGGDGAAVRKPAKQAARSRARKSGGVRAGQGSRGKARKSGGSRKR